MKLKDLQENWQKFGETDTLWAIRYKPRDEGNWDIGAFFATGHKEVKDLIVNLESLGLELPDGVALDFGCGIGRITQPLSLHFKVCYGVDIAPKMLEIASKYNRYGDKCQYLLNETDDLKQFADNSINFIWSVATFQCIPAHLSKEYIKEFIRILTVDGLLVFQISSTPINVRQVIKNWLPQPILDLFYMIKYQGRPYMQLTGIKTEQVVKLIEDNGGRLLNIQPYSDPGTSGEWTSFQYYVTKK